MEPSKRFNLIQRANPYYLPKDTQCPSMETAASINLPEVFGFHPEVFVLQVKSILRSMVIFYHGKGIPLQCYVEIRIEQL